MEAEGRGSVDNSDWGRNGDFHPTRWDSLQETARLLCESKLSANRESTVGLMTMGGRRVNLLATPCADDGRLVTSLQSIKLGMSAIYGRWRSCGVRQGY